MPEKNLIGTYWNRLYDLGEMHGPFLLNGRIKAKSAGKNLYLIDTNMKARPPNRQIRLPLTNLFLLLSKRPSFGRGH